MVKTTPIIHRNQLLFTLFGKTLCHIESMTSKVEPTKNYWTNEVKSAARCRLLNCWWRKPGDKVVLYLVRRKTEHNGKTPLRRRKYFEWLIKQLLNSAFVGYEEFCRSCRVLSTEAEPWSAEFFISYSASFNIAKYMHVKYHKVIFLIKKHRKIKFR